ncbi:MAG: dolichyl-phosphate-mannose-protein mannosyltransferase [Pseudonocardiales bacterium]|nr:dolichyl-phosphate-mannose-protein mannosyltransferase [Pseudonocardiales bacterium]
MTATLEAPARADATDGGDAKEPPQPARPVPAALAPWRDPHPWVGWLTLLLVTAVAAITRLWAIGFPHTKNFDEVYYANEAQELLRFGYEDNRGYMFIVHPPLGKWLIALSEQYWHSRGGLDSIGWRLAPAIAGVISVVLITRIVRRMLRSNLFGAIAGLLLALDGLSLVLSRTALLDIFLQTFVLAGFGALVVDRDQVRARLAGLIADGADLSSGVPSLGPRPWRLVAGIMFGAACAVKWSALSYFVLFVLLSFVWDRAALKTAGALQPTRNTVRRSLLPASGSLLAAPLAVYLLSYLGWFTGENSWGRHYADTHSASTHLNLPLGIHLPFTWSWVPGPIRSLGSYTLNAYRFHEGLSSGHPYESSQWSWLVLGRPVDFSYNGSEKTCGSSTCAREILLIGTPLMWWAFVPALLWLAWHWFTTRDWRAGAVWVAFVAGWFVWFPDAKRTKFLFYMAPLVPFLIIAVTLGLGVMLGPALRRTGDFVRDRHSFRRRQWGMAGIAVYLGLVVIDFAWMWPIFTGGLLTFDTWHAHMWLPSWV